MRKNITSEKVAQAPSLLSQGVEAGGFVFLSGQVGSDADWNLVDSTVEGQTRQIMENIIILLAEADLKIDDIVKVTIYTTNLSFGKAINEVYSSYFSEALPAREMIGVKELPLGALVEMSVIAGR